MGGEVGPVWFGDGEHSGLVEAQRLGFCCERGRAGCAGEGGLLLRGAVGEGDLQGDFGGGEGSTLGVDDGDGRVDGVALAAPGVAHVDGPDVHPAAGLVGEIGERALVNGPGDLAAAAVEGFVESGGSVIEGRGIEVLEYVVPEQGGFVGVGHEQGLDHGGGHVALEEDAGSKVIEAVVDEILSGDLPGAGVAQVGIHPAVDCLGQFLGFVRAVEGHGSVPGGVGVAVGVHGDEDIGLLPVAEGVAVAVGEELVGGAGHDDGGSVFFEQVAQAVGDFEVDVAFFEVVEGVNGPGIAAAVAGVETDDTAVEGTFGAGGGDEEDGGQQEGEE